REAPAVSIETRDHVLVAVAVDIHREHLGAALVAELEEVRRPESGPLLPPALVEDQVGLPIAVDIAPARAVIELVVLPFRGDRAELPGLRRIALVRRHEPPPVLPMAHERRRAVVDHERRRFAEDALEDGMLLPRAGLA